MGAGERPGLGWSESESESESQSQRGEDGQGGLLDDT